MFETSQQTPFKLPEPAGYGGTEQLIQPFHLIDVGRITGHPGEALPLLIPFWTSSTCLPRGLGIGHAVKVTELKRSFAPLIQTERETHPPLGEPALPRAPFWGVSW